MRVLVIANGSKPKARKMLDQMHKWSISEHQFFFHTTSSSGECAKLLLQAQFPLDVLIAIGGDGTIHECVQGIMQLDVPLRPALLVIPCGTGNDYFRGMSGSVIRREQIIQWLRQKNFVTVDVLKITAKNGDIVYSNNVADVGIGPEVVKHTNNLWYRIPGKLRFLLGSMKALLHFKPRIYSVSIDGQTLHQPFLSIVMAKGNFFGGGLGIAPEAALNSGKIHVTLIGNITLLDYLKHLHLLFRNKKINHPEIFYGVADTIVIKGEGIFEADGELYGSLPIEVTVLKNALLLVHPINK